MIDLTGDQALKKLLDEYADVQVILDVGSGRGEHADILRSAGRTVITNSLEPPADLICDFADIDEDVKYQGIWAAHVLEHQPNPNNFLKKCFRLLEDNGVLVVTVPPMKHEIVGGHVSLWNPGILLYQLILAGFDCSQARVKQYGYNISAIVRKKAANLPTLRMDSGDIEKLAEFFPMPVRQGFNGNFTKVNW